MAGWIDSCCDCEEVATAFSSNYKGTYVFLIHLDVNLFSSKLKHNEIKKRKLKEIEKKVSALRNTSGGEILVHLQGQDTEDRYLGHFDNFTDACLKNLIPDGQLFTDVYRRQWLWDVFPGFESTPVLLLTVNKARSVCTVHFYTKVASDCMIENASTIGFISLLSRKVITTATEPTLRGIHNFEKRLHENRHIELKSVFTKKDRTFHNISSFVDYIWTDLRFRENLCSMSKLEGGGSFFVGINERNGGGTYDSREINPNGFPCNWNVDELKTSLDDKLECDASYQRPDGALTSVPTTLIEVALYNSPLQKQACPHNFKILEIAVGYAAGIVFYNKKGPETYTIEEKGNICRMEHCEWLERIQSFSIVDNKQ
ncbi:uncharacterized protein LOC124265948 isoform X3 [Haliotis rubra]|uniref:uncharacterized protein LOC124265948 isoform X3 n=1 Tax=Haliotis rubra TaxID=36100 RepID=UPI001EE58C4F|nr:uncharacterized protein LOC124265948 isoform X3 [Haliotis rubra]